MCADTTDPTTPAAPEGTDYRDTLFLPETDFPMRAGLPKREPDWLARWEKLAVYTRLRESAGERPVFVLHDGPPYANGHLHIGHALNKILKDFVVRSAQMRGYDSRYVPGWDCHGLPIEWKIEEQYRKKGKSKDAVPVNELRAECRRFADEWIDVQRAEFKRLGVIGNWEDPYLTMAFDAEAVIAEEFHKFVMNGTVYQGSKPVMWSPMEKTALAEAEIEYHDRQIDTIWVKFPVRMAASNIATGGAPGSDLLDAAVVIWTTTPWTIPSNRGIAFGAEIAYGLYEVTEAPEGNWVTAGEKLVMADALAADILGRARLEPGSYKRVRQVGAEELAGLTCAHPLAAADGFWGYDVPVMAADFVTDDTGSGFVHCAPSHGEDDYELFRQKGLLDRITHNIGPAGEFLEHVPFFAGNFILDRKGREGTANKVVVEKLREIGALAATRRQTISDAHSWRSKAPVIRLNRPQWFVAIDKPLDDGMGAHGQTIRERALKSINELVAWYPKTGQNRLRSMIENRPDWVLSRQRAWGVPLACFCRTTPEGRVELLQDAAVNARIVEAFRTEGADAWFAEGARERFLAGVPDAGQWEMVTDILDVWFDSGSTHAFVLRDRADGPADAIADVYLEGTDQHRGWFHSSLLQGCGTRGRAPYKAVVTHGFTLDEKGQKMSKSLGTGVAPQDVIKQYGADILRLWVAQCDYTADMRIGPEILKGTADSYRRLRNTLRFLLGALAGFDEAERVEPAEMPELERWVLHRLAELDERVRKGYEGHDFQGVMQSLFTFATGDLSAFYFDIRKDALYCDAPDSLRRRACRTVLDLLFHRLVRWLAPVLVFTMEEVWLSRFDAAGEGEDSVHLHDFPETPAAWRDAALAARWERIRAARRVVNGALEGPRREKTIGASLEAAPTLYVADPETAAALQGIDMAELCITSGLSIAEHDVPAEAFRLEDERLGVVFHRAEGEKCARCWRVLPDVGRHARPGLCGRCDSVIGAGGR
ncbi:isoleucine--tRNA ligase [Paralimibaculum aggregatum]|uniref:Isoleucine--tRNA ligase n=1 Tax=Paralimibaculum aggregatum TaxID=3036245 RepID=A0ABQ6LJ84_9RHOB|nr:isoleucine--tRNA ligase [Limibaculum sp. NKW23]GMG82224.1 isoleucine--tRNA ligase [Limibaculum sp. NKW23]